jgi:hypothetical protein
MFRPGTEPGGHEPRLWSAAAGAWTACCTAAAYQPGPSLRPAPIPPDAACPPAWLPALLSRVRPASLELVHWRSKVAH